MAGTPENLGQSDTIARARASARHSRPKWPEMTRAVSGSLAKLEASPLGALRMSALDSPLLQATLRDELRAAWLTLQEKHGQDGLYGFGVYTTPSASYLMVTAFSEKGLDEAVAQYVADFSEGGRAADVRQTMLAQGGTPDDPALWRRALRWSPCDSPLHEVGSPLLPQSDRIIHELDLAGRWADDDEMDDDEFDEACEAPDPELDELFRVIVLVLQGLDREGLFGTGAARDRLVLSVWQGDQSDRSRYGFAKSLNPPGVTQRFGREMNDEAQADDKLWNRRGKQRSKPEVFE